MSGEAILWTIFAIVIPIMLVLDLGVFHRKAHAITIKEAFIWSGIWIGLALVFNAGVYWLDGREKAMQFLTGFLLEKSLSVDNLFVFLLVFSFFRTPAAYQHTVLFWGILGAVVMRAIFIVSGIALIHQFEWLIYVFGAFLIVTAIKLAAEKDKEIHPDQNLVLKIFRRFVPITDTYESDKFFVRKNFRTYATPLFVVLLVVETTDVVFAVDSIPAIFGVTTDPFIVYTSNIFAILGLRSLYFALAGMMELFHFLHYGLSVILAFIGIKMLASAFFHVPIDIALWVIAIVLTLSVAASLIWPKHKGEQTSADALK